MLEKQQNNHEHLQVERAIDELRRQQGITLTGAGNQKTGYFPAEFIQTDTPEPAFLLVTAARAKNLGLPAASLRIRAAGLDMAQRLALTDPTAPQPPLPQLATQPASHADALALKLAKYASLLPALVIPAAPPAPWLQVDMAEAERYITHPQVEVFETSQAQLPIEAAEQTRILCFRTRQGMSTHLALLIGTPEKQGAPLVRVHSSCVTGDILGSLRCDCGDQLHMALEQIAQAGSGVLIYLHQEGRGIGIANKLRAYRLQEQGIDTFDANLMLGFEEDERDFSVAAAILRYLGIGPITLLTNNPHKRAALENAGITVKDRVGLVAASGRHNHAYLQAKVKKSGHLF